MAYEPTPEDRERQRTMTDSFLSDGEKRYVALLNGAQPANDYERSIVETSTAIAAKGGVEEIPHDVHFDMNDRGELIAQPVAAPTYLSTGSRLPPRDPTPEEQKHMEDKMNSCGGSFGPPDPALKP